MDPHATALRIATKFLLTAALIAVSSCAATSQHAHDEPSGDNTGPRQRALLDADWRFHLGDLPSTQPVVATNYDDTAWARVDVPHDYVLDGKYANSPDRTVRGHGYLPYDVGWYRRHFAVPTSDAGKILRLDFDGVFRDCEVWLNGQSLGKHASGYTPFSLDITKIAKLGGDNVLAVRVDPRKWEGWWYEGGGIYRHVHLTAIDPLHVAQWGTQVVATVPDGDKGGDASADL